MNRNAGRKARKVADYSEWHRVGRETAEILGKSVTGSMETAAMYTKSALRPR
jgi:hypothetical protein